MEVVIEKNKGVSLKNGTKTLSMTMGGNGDLYWIIKNVDCFDLEEYSNDYFEISREDDEIYSLFEQLMLDIKNINIEEEIQFPLYVETKEDRKEYLEKKLKQLDLEKKRCREHNDSNYNYLYNRLDTILWHSDETLYEEANILKIEKINDAFRVSFSAQYVDGIMGEDNICGVMSVRINNSGSRYSPFNIIFMRMFQKIQNIDMSCENYTCTCDAASKKIRSLTK